MSTANCGRGEVLEASAGLDNFFLDGAAPWGLLPPLPPAELLNGLTLGGLGGPCGLDGFSSLAVVFFGP